MPFNKPRPSLEAASPTDIFDLHMRAIPELSDARNYLINTFLVVLVGVVSTGFPGAGSFM